jgi:outer membrane lipoprotein-sorting protein
MRSRMMRLALTMILLPVWIGVCAAGSLDEIRQAAEKIVSIQADFLQEKQMPILAKPLLAHGSLAYQRPASLRWEYRQPVKSVLLLDNGAVHRFVQSNDKWREEQISGNGQMMDFMLQEIAKWLNGHFDDNPLFDVSLKSGGKIIMTPKQEGMHQFIQRIEMTMADQPGVIREVVIYESADTFTRFVFSHPRINVPIAPAEFQKVQ